MAKAPFRFSIMKNATLYYQVAGSDVTTSDVPVYYNDIVDWQKLCLDYKRDMLFLGLIRGYSPSTVRFIKQAAKILRYIKNTQGGIEAEAYLEVSEWNKSTFQYDLIDYWQFDFSPSKNYEKYFDAALMDGGLSALLKAYGSQNYTIPLNDPALAPDFPPYNPVLPNEIDLFPPPTYNPAPPPTPQLIYCDGIPILGSQEYVTDQDGELVAITNSVLSRGTAMTLASSKAVGDYSVGTANTSTANSTIGLASDPTTAFTFLCETACSMTIKWNMGFFYRNTPSSSTVDKRLKLMYFVHAGGGGGWGALITSGILQQDTAFVAVGDNSPALNWSGQSLPIILNPGQLLSVGFTYDQSATGVLGDELIVHMNALAASPALPAPSIVLDYMFVPDSSVVRGITHNQVLQYLFTQLVGNGGSLPFPGEDPDSVSYGFTCRSNLLSTPRYPAEFPNYDLDPSCTFFTCGDALRGLKTVTIVDPYYNDGNPFDCYIVPAIYTSMADFAKDMLTDLMGSIGVEKNGYGTDKLVAESLYYFFDDSKIIADLGDNIADFEMTDFNDFRGSTITMGQNDQQFDALNGPLETLSEVEFTTPVTRIRKTIDFKTPYRADPYGVEIVRANIGNKTNVNSSSDNDTFKLQVQSLATETVLDLSNWNGLSGYTVEVNALKLKRAIQIEGGLPAPLLITAGLPVCDKPMFNPTFSPQRKALRCLPWLKSNYGGLPNSLMSISAFKKNIRNVWNAGGGGNNPRGMIIESNWLNLADEDQTYTPPFSSNPVTIWRDTRPLIFKPYVFTFTSPVKFNLSKQMTPPGTPGGGNMYGKIKFNFTRDGIKYPLAGFVLEAGRTPGTDAPFRFKLLCSPTVNIPALL